MGDPLAARRLVRGAVTELAGTVLVRLLSLVRLVVLARLFLPSEYGAYSTGLLIIAPALLVVNAGFHASVVKAPESRLPVVFWSNLVLSSGVALGCMLIVLAAGPPLAVWLDDSRLPTVLLVLGLAIFETPASLPLALLDRRFRFATARVLEGVGILAGLVVTVALYALGTAPVYAMAAGHVSFVLSRAGAFWLTTRPWPAFAVARDEMRAQAAFSLPLVATGAFGFVAARGDDLAVRVLWGNEALGLYSVAFYAPSVLQEIGMALDRVSLPVFSRVEGREALRDAFGFGTRLVALLTVPAGFAGAAFAGPLVGLAFGPNWASAAAPLAIFSVAFGLKACTGVNWGAVVMLADRTRDIARVTIATAVSMVLIGFPVIAAFGPMGAAWYTLAFVLVISPLLRFPILRSVLGDLSFLRGILRPVAVSGALAAVAWGLGSQAMSPVMGTVGAVVMAGVAMAGVLAMDPTLMRALRRTAPSP